MNNERREEIRKELKMNALQGIRRLMKDDSITAEDLDKIRQVVQYSTKDYIYDPNL